MAKQQQPMVTAVFRNQLDADRAFTYLHGKGYRDSDINVLMSDQTRTSLTSDDETRHDAKSAATEGLGIGGAIGTAVGAGIAAVAAIGTTLAVPGLGLVVAGPIAAALAGGGAGAVTGGLIGTLVGLGVTEQNANAYSEALKNGGIAIGVRPRNSSDADDIKQSFEEFRGENVCVC